jgi:hypothetical protein
MTLRQSMSNDMLTVFLSEDEFAETVTYLPRDGGSRTILAVVDREPPALMDEAGNVISLTYVIYVKNDKTDGISGEEVDTGGDRVEIIWRLNKIFKKQCSIVKVQNHDHGMLQIALR